MNNEEKNLQVLLTLLNIRHDNCKSMREHALKTTTTSTALFMLLLGWIIQKNIGNTLIELIFLSCIVFVFWIGNILVLRDIKTGLINSYKVIIKIEHHLNLYEPNAFKKSLFGIDEESLHPEHWKNSVRARTIEKYIFIVSLTAFISIIVIILKFLTS